MLLMISFWFGIGRVQCWNGQGHRCWSGWKNSRWTGGRWSPAL